MNGSTETIDLLALFAFTALALLSAVAHFLYKRMNGELQGTVREYLFKNNPARTGVTFFMIVGSSIAAAMTGGLDGFKPEIAWAYLQHWQLPMPVLHVASAACLLGWSFDSAFNKGAKPDEPAK